MLPIVVFLDGVATAYGVNEGDGMVEAVVWPLGGKARVVASELEAAVF